MGFNRRSVATLRDPEFVNITSISPLVSKCEIKVLYVGENRNRSFITKEVATEMAQTLPGCPIVGWFIEDKEDFGDHGDQIIIDGEGIKFKKLTKPYGFVAPNSRVWFQEFEDTDEFGNKVIREYLMTEGFLWTEQYEECKRVVEMGNPQSMELDEKTLKGHWSVNTNTGVEFFIINDAIFSKLCILGEDVEPCFEGANVSAPEVSSKFSKDDNFTKSLFTMMEQLKYTLSNDEGGQLGMDGDLTNVVVEPVVEEAPASVEENFSAELGNDNESSTVENQNNIEEFTQDSISSEETPVVEEASATEDFAKKEDEEEEKPEENDDDKKDKDEDKEEDDEDSKKKFELLEAEHAELQSKYEALEASYQELVEFKKQIEDKEKDELIASFYMLSDEDKAEVIANKANYSLKEIKAELSMICVDKKVNFNLNEEKELDKPLTYNLSQSDNVSKPAWLKAVDAQKERLNK